MNMLVWYGDELHIYAYEGLSRYVQFMKICKSEMYYLKKILRIEKFSTI